MESEAEKAEAEEEEEVREEVQPHRPRRERAVRALLQRCGRVARQHGAQRGAVAKRRVGAQRHGAGAVARGGELLGFVPALQLRLGVENKLAQPSAKLALRRLYFSARPCARRPGASVSLGQSASWSAPAGHTGLGFGMELRLPAAD